MLWLTGRTSLAAALAAMAAGLAACGQGAPAADLKNDPAVKKLLAELPPQYAAADLANGKGQVSLCRSCHTLVEGGANMTGPNLYGVFGRAVASKSDFGYSAGLKAKGGNWDAAALDAWIADPKAVVPTTKMSFPGLKDASDRRDLIAYLKVATSGGPQ